MNFQKRLFYASCLLIASLALIDYCADPALNHVEAILISFGGTVVMGVWATTVIPSLVTPDANDESDTEPEEVSRSASSESGSEDSESSESNESSEQRQPSESNEQSQPSEPSDNRQGQHSKRQVPVRRSPRRFFQKKCQHCGSC